MDKKTIYAYSISIVFVMLLVVFFDFKKVIEEVSRFNILIFSATILLHVLSFPLRALIWKIIVDPIKKISFKDSFNIICISFFANFVLPLRIGELLRAFLLSKITKISKAAALSTVIIARTIEALVLVGFFLIGLAAFPAINTEIQAIIIGIGVFFLTVFMALVFFENFLEIGKKIGAKKFFPQKITDIVVGLLSSGKFLKNNIKATALLFLLSAALWLLHAVIYFAVSFGLGLDLGLTEILLIVSFSSLSAMIPSSPGFIGTFQAAFATIFVALGLNAELGISMSVIIHLGSYISTIILGLFSAKNMSISITDIFRNAKKISE